MQEASRSAESSNSGARDQCVVFIDDSNIFIEAQKYYARYLKLRVKQDPRCRLDIGKLIDLAVHGRKVCYGKLYGSEPPALDTVWNKLREQGLEVDAYPKSFTGKEKKVDTALSTEMTEYAIINRSEAHKPTIIIIAGDRDYCPPVEKSLSYGWKVELVAFERSIAKEIADIKNDNYKVTRFESLLEVKECRDSCCYVSARWRIESYRLPKDRTIVLHFKSPLISLSELQQESTKGLLKKYANEITQITGIPCFYHLHKWEPYTGCRVYIINGHRPTKVERRSEQIDFFRICKDQAHQLNTKCLEISPLYEKYTTMMESGDATDDVLKTENRFSALDVEDITEWSDDYFLSHIYDDDQGQDVIEATEGPDQASPEERSVRPYSPAERRKSVPKYSTACPFEFSCTNGVHCKHTHTQAERRFFKANGGKGHKGYKSKPCRYHYEKNRSCKRDPKECSYYHSIDEARCYVCKTNNRVYIGHASHDHA